MIIKHWPERELFWHFINKDIMTEKWFWNQSCWAQFFVHDIYRHFDFNIDSTYETLYNLGLPRGKAALIILLYFVFTYFSYVLYSLLLLQRMCYFWYNTEIERCSIILFKIRMFKMCRVHCLLWSMTINSSLFMLNSHNGTKC